MKPLTTREVGEIVGQPEWLVRRIVDKLAPPVEKFGHKRMIPPARLPEIQTAITARQNAKQGASA